MKKPKYIQLLEQAELYKKLADDCIKEARKFCPHNNIESDCFCNDEWALNKTYTWSYRCPVCGVYASYSNDGKQEKNELFKKLEIKYYKNRVKMIGGVK